MTTKPITQPQTIPSPPPTPPSGRRTRLTVLPDPPRPLDMQQQLPYLSRTFIILDDHFSDRPDVGVGGEGYLCLDARDYPGAPRPDCLVVIDAPVPPAEILASNGYVINEIGKAPDFVLEIASESTGRRDYVEKPGIYAGFGVREYWRFDHTGGQYHNAALAGDRMIAGRYQPIPIRVGIDGVWRGYCAVLDLELHWYEKRLRFWDPATGEYLPDLGEAKQQRDAAQAERDAAQAERDAAQAQRNVAIIQRDVAEAWAAAETGRADQADARADDADARAVAESTRADTEAARADAADARARAMAAELERLRGNDNNT